MRRCPFDHTALELMSDGVIVDTWQCPVCHYQESYGMEQLPDPERLRGRADRLNRIADELEAGDGLAGALGRFAA